MSNVYVDTQLIGDGSQRWLWRILGDHALYGAGVAMSLTDAESQAHNRMIQLADLGRLGRPAESPRVVEKHTLNLDELESGGDADAQAVRQQARRAAGHTEASDPPRLAGI